MGLGIIDDSARVAHMDMLGVEPCRPECIDHLPESRDLPKSVFVTDLGHRKMRHEALDMYAARGSKHLCYFTCLPRLKPKPSHAGVELEVYPDGFHVITGTLNKLCENRRVVHHGCQVVPDKRFNVLPGKQTAHDKYGTYDAA